MAIPTSFNSLQIAAIMDVLAKAAVAEITKLVDDGTVVLRLEMCQRESEIDDLKKSLQIMERELRKAQEASSKKSNDRKSNVINNVGVQVGSPTKDHEEEQTSLMVYTTAQVDPNGFNKQHKSEHREKDLGRQRFLVKAEQVEQHVAQTTVQDTGTIESVDFEMEERDGQLWASVTQGICGKDPVDSDGSNAIEQCLQIFSAQSDQYTASTVLDNSCNSLSAPGKPLHSFYGTVPVKVEPEMHSVYNENTMSSHILAEQGQYSSPLYPVVRDEEQGLLPRLQLSRPQQESVMRSAASTSQSNSHIQDIHTLNKNRFKTKRAVNVWRAGTNAKVFICSVCGKSFPRFCQLEAHQFTHAGVKPYRCLQCGKSFTQKTRLKTHQSVHTGERPFSCKICGKMFSRQDNCTRHERFHSGLKPFSCAQCGKSFTVLSNLKIHQQTHS